MRGVVREEESKRMCVSYNNFFDFTKTMIKIYFYG